MLADLNSEWMAFQETLQDAEGMLKKHKVRSTLYSRETVGL